MVLTRTTIAIREGERVEILISPALYGEAQERGINLDLRLVKEGTMDYLYKQIGIVYFGALVAWKARMWDDPTLDPFPYKFIDFVNWATNDAESFKDTMLFVAQAFNVSEDKPEKKKTWLAKILRR